MKKDLVELVFIIDKSGSMQGLESDTIGGFNSLIEKQKKEPGEAILSLVLFDTNINFVYDRINIKDVPELTEKEYYASGCTALLDAVGTSISYINHVRESLLEELKPEKTLIVITTDGLENSSREYTYPKVKELISKAKESGYEFIFLGANIDSEVEASKIGIAKEFAATYKHTSRGVRNSMKAFECATSIVRNGEQLDESWKGELIDDNEEEKPVKSKLPKWLTK